jgi:hypothetical protein
MLRTLGAALLVGSVASLSIVARAEGPAGELSVVSLEWPDSVTLPSATADSTLLQDAQVQPASDCAAADLCCDPCGGSPCCDELSCGECASGLFGVAWGCEPMWVASAGAVFLHRSRPDQAPIVTPPTGTPGVTIGGADFGFGWDVGPDVSLMRRTASGYIIEGRYFNNRDANASFNIPAITTFRVAGIGVTILGGGSINGFYTTKLDSTELNIHVPVHSRVTLLTGFRWVELHDALRLNIATPATFTNWDLNNHMYGGQFGANFALTRPANPLKVNLVGKAGVYANDADNRFTSTIVGGSQDEDTATAFVGEVNLTASYRLTRHIALRGGYQVLWLDNVALASEAAAGTVQAAGGTRSTINTDGRLWYNGALAGAEFIW